MSGSRPVLAVHGALSRGAFAVVVLVSLAVLFTPGSDIPSAAPGVDKIVHVALFASLAVTGLWAGIRTAVLVGLLVLYAAASEVVQALSALERSGSVADWAADVLGVIAGLLLWAGIARRT
ncbi:VanZ family protein [Geodermatophilus ruber]|uniref:VanZ like family protein n=1 Tax=Geodermatophilus ruber TaxID=504800 RepID=A0A1I4L1L8_9ACTN|nr:VanZ family protein [Geodermatophilus ruber]SFL84766.1 VanZ like family protein [Geodermatophilus ruber]